MISIVNETAAHHDAVRQLTVDAFAESALGHNGEADLIEAIRHDCRDALSPVALERGVVIGHVLFSPATIRCEGKTYVGMGLGPMAVLPSRQRRGVGSMLVTHGLDQLALRDTAFTVVAGHPDYYTRFGFVSTASLSITHGFAGMPQDILFIHAQRAHSRFRDGLLYYHEAFGPQHVA